MKKVLLLAGIFLISFNAMAMKASWFSYDHARVESALINATVLDNYVSTAHLSADQIPSGNPILSNFKAEDNLPALGPDAPLGIPGFCWGFVFGVVGILIVYLVSEDKQETQNALFGCIVVYLLAGGCYLISVASTSTTQ